VNEKSVIGVSGITKYLVAASALAMALAAAPAPAAIVVSQTFAHEAWELGDVIDSVLSEITDFATPGAGALPLEIPDEREERQRLLETPDIFFVDAGSACQPPPTSPPTGGSGGAAILNAVSQLEPSSLRTSLPCDPAIILPTGPLLEILRPA